MPLLWAVGSLLVGVVAFKAGSRFVDNLQENHRKGTQALLEKPATFGEYWEGVAESNLEPYGAEDNYWVTTGPGIDIAGEKISKGLYNAVKGRGIGSVFNYRGSNYLVRSCPGAAHTNPHIDNCGTCAPLWGRLLVKIPK